MHSHHSHSGEFCKHAKSMLEEVVAYAYDINFTHFHLSEHTPREYAEQLYPEEEEAGLTPAGLAAQFRAYLAKARAIQREYAVRPRPMHVLVGCETENISSPASIDFLTRVLQPAWVAGDDTARPKHLPPAYVGIGVVDYLVGSVHHACGVPIDFDKSTFERALRCCSGDASKAQPIHAPMYWKLLDAYLDAQYEVMDRLRPEVIGHMDLYRLFAPQGPWLPSADSDQGAALRMKLTRNIRFAVSYGALIEANSAAFRKGWDGETYPGREVLRMIRAAHGRIALSDDSHGTEQVALNYQRLRGYLAAEGVDEIWVLESDHTPHIPDPHTVWTTYKEQEDARKLRFETNGTSSAPPTHYPRGTRAVAHGPSWQQAPFWTTLPASRAT
ncbi:histidinol-phosphatase [Malassezia vespertilionis]|uniref:Histidinol-phosphatase n=1 Tax=Malassezia vespertilionis TaxID=2020962 RepID=A0A2N1J829_9BASI|nr:histidinol-phosphatase [Malassezia vespertilionis]PKI82693.1 His2p [Malassezia vespertilionis]WFD08607.1 histidinol-phosphatase [Malassezia vespertilionis]